MGDGSSFRTISNRLRQAWAIAAKDMRIYYLQPPMIMFGLLMPFLMFFSFSIKREMGLEMALARLLAITTFFTASSAGPVIMPLEQRTKTYDRLLVAPLPLTILLLGKSLGGPVFAIVISALTLAAPLVLMGASVASWPMTAVVILVSTFVFSVLGLLFASWPSSSPGSIMMPSTLIRWPLMFISGVFVPLEEMTGWSRALSYISPLTYSQDLMHHAVAGGGVFPVSVDLAALAVTLLVWILLTIWFHRLRRRWGY